MEHINKDIEFNVKSSENFNKIISAKPGTGMSFSSIDVSDYVGGSKEASDVILANATQMLILKTS